jgi:hypothetical protein
MNINLKESYYLAKKKRINLKYVKEPCTLEPNRSELNSHFQHFLACDFEQATESLLLNFLTQHSTTHGLKWSYSCSLEPTLMRRPTP